ncbi:MAG: hemolysin family protein [Acidimicrobiia bacterium]
MFLIVVNAFFVAGEFSLVTVERSRVARRVQEGDRRARRILGGLSRLSFHLSGAQLGITVSSLVLGLIAERALAPVIEPVLGWIGVSESATGPITVGAALAISTALLLVLGELVPKNIAISFPYPTAVRVGLPMLVVNNVLSPIISVLNAAANRTVRLLGIEPREELAGVRSLEELELIIRASGEGGMLSTEELALLTRSLAFTANLTADAMIPRVQVVGLPATATVRDLQRAAIKSGHSRFPVYGSDLDDVLGVAHVKDSLRVRAEARDTEKITDHMRPALVIPESQPLDTVLFELRTRGSGLAIVTDEYGGTAGIVTSEDLLEELVGEIKDEHDRDEPEVRPDSLSGLLHRHELETAIGFAWPEGRYETLGGLITAELGHLPVVGETVTVDGWTFRVESVDGFRVASARLLSSPEDL